MKTFYLTGVLIALSGFHAFVTNYHTPHSQTRSIRVKSTAFIDPLSNLNKMKEKLSTVRYNGGSRRLREGGGKEGKKVELAGGSRKPAQLNLTPTPPTPPTPATNERGD